MLLHLLCVYYTNYSVTSSIVRLLHQLFSYFIYCAFTTPTIQLHKSIAIWLEMCLEKTQNFTLNKFFLHLSKVWQVSKFEKTKPKIDDASTKHAHFIYVDGLYIHR